MPLGGAAMSAEQINLPIQLISSLNRTQKEANADLIGRKFSDRDATMTVIQVCPPNFNQVTVCRDLDGKTWSVPAWMVRRIIGKTRRKAA
jgi:hypothetical protein